MLKKALLSTILAMPLAGCLSLGAEPPDQLLTLTPTQVAPAGGSITAPANAALAVQTSDSSLAYLKDAVWVEKPARLFQSLIVETIRAKGNRLVVREEDLGQSAVATLSGRLLDMGYDVASGSAVVRYDGVLQRADGPVQTRRFESRVPAAAEAAAVAPALNQAANEVADQVAEWVG